MPGGGATVRLAGREDEAVIAGLRCRWAEEQAGGPIEVDGYGEVFAAWFEREHEQRLTWERVIKYGSMVLLPLLCILVATAIWSRTLQRRVAERTEELAPMPNWQTIRFATALSEEETTSESVPASVTNRLPVL